MITTDFHDQQLHDYNHYGDTKLTTTSFFHTKFDFFSFKAIYGDVHQTSVPCSTVYDWLIARLSFSHDSSQ